MDPRFADSGNFRLPDQSPVQGKRPSTFKTGINACAKPLGGTGKLRRPVNIFLNDLLCLQDWAKSIEAARAQRQAGLLANVKTWKKQRSNNEAGKRSFVTLAQLWYI